MSSYLGKLKSRIEPSVQSNIIVAEKDLVQQRLSLCNSCEHQNKLRFCNKCGCYLPAKTRLKHASCPLKKW